MKRAWLALGDRVFPYLDRFDHWTHDYRFHPRLLCRLVGWWEIGYYNRNTDWDNPIYVRPLDEFPEDRRP